MSLMRFGYFYMNKKPGNTMPYARQYRQHDEALLEYILTVNIDLGKM